MNYVTPIDLLHILPLLVITFFAVVIMVADAFTPKGSDRDYAAYMSFVGIVTAAIIEYLLWRHSSTVGQPLMGGMLVHDKFSIFFNFIYFIAGAGVVLQAVGYFKAHRFHHGEFYTLLLASLLGLMLLGMATDMLMLFVAIELMSISVYVLAGFERHKLRSAEAALKYFLMGAFASAVMLFGLALIYGTTGNTSYASIHDKVMLIVSSGKPLAEYPAFMIGIFMVLIGFAFKAALVPFHMWTPDAYEGAPTPSTAYMAAAVKAGAFAALLRFVAGVMPGLFASFPGWGDLLWALAILTMLFGNLFALTQDNIKRMLAYSSIAHAGYILVGVIAAGVSGSQQDAASVLFYLVVYTIASIGAFAVVIRLGNKDDENLIISKDYRGLGYKDPLSGIALAFFMLTFAGFPPTAGFISKFYVFKAAVSAGFIDLAIVGVLTSLLSIYYYARVVVYLYMKSAPEEGVHKFTLDLPVAIVISIAALFVVLLGVVPGDTLGAAQTAVSEFFKYGWLAVR